MHPDHHLFQADTYPDGHHPTTFALKTFHSHAGAIMYQCEMSASEASRGDSKSGSHIVKYLGTFRHGDTLNILLDYSEHGTLEDFLGIESRHIYYAFYSCGCWVPLPKPDSKTVLRHRDASQLNHVSIPYSERKHVVVCRRTVMCDAFLGKKISKQEF